MKNKYGLPRHIPEAVALEVRRRSKFGCVICRSAIYQYEHIDPEFADATEHEPDKICLLCGGCHDKVTRGRLSKETVKAKYNKVMESDEIQNPFEELDLSAHNICVDMATVKFEYARHILRINGRDLFSITPPRDGSSFPSLDGVFCDSNGHETLRITNNVWEGAVEAWDIRVVGKEVSVKTAGGRTALVLRIEPPDKVIVRELDMYLDNCHVVCGKGGLLVGRVSGDNYVYIGVGDFDCKGAEVGIDVNSHGGNLVPSGISMVGGKGVELDGTGIRIAVGAQLMHVNDLKVWVE